MYEFARRKGSKDKKPRRRKALGVAKAIAGGAGIAGAGLLAVKASRVNPKSLLGIGARTAAIGTGGAYTVKKLLDKKENYSRINTSTGDIMFIGNVEKTSYEFARPKGAKDRKPRSRRSMLGTGAKIAGGLAGAGAIGYAGIKNRKAIGAGLSKAGGFAKKQAGAARDVAIAGEMKARQMGRKGMSAARRGAGAVGRGAENLRTKTARAGYGAADRVGGAIAGARSAIAGGKAELNKRVMRKLPKNQRPQ